MDRFFCVRFPRDQGPGTIFEETSPKLQLQFLFHPIDVLMLTMRTMQHVMKRASQCVKKNFTSVTPRQDTLLSWPANTPETKLLWGELFYCTMFLHNFLLVAPDKIGSRSSPALSARILSHTLQLKSSYPGEGNESTFVLSTRIGSTDQCINFVETLLQQLVERIGSSFTCQQKPSRLAESDTGYPTDDVVVGVLEIGCVR